MTFPWPFLWRLQENLTNLFLGWKTPDILTSTFILIKNVERAWFDEELTAIRCYVCFHSCLHRDAYIQRLQQHAQLCLFLICTMLCWRHKRYTICAWDRHRTCESLTLVGKTWTTESVFVMATRLVTNIQHSFFGDGLQAWSAALIMQWQPTPKLLKTSGPQAK